MDKKGISQHAHKHGSTDIRQKKSLNMNMEKWNILFDKSNSEWIAFQPKLGLQVYPCYACRKLFGVKSSFLDHVNRRGMMLKYKCSVCIRSEELIFYNPCSFLLHTRQHYKLSGGQINLTDLTICNLPLGLCGFLPNPKVPLFYNVEDDQVDETLFINTRFYSPSQECMGRSLINLIPLELFFLTSRSNQQSTYLVLKQISNNIPRCQFVTFENSSLASNNNSTNNNRTENNTNKNNVTIENEIQIKQDPFEITEVTTINDTEPIINESESILKNCETKSESICKVNDKYYPRCLECGETQVMPMGKHFLKGNKPFNESLKCSICKYIAPSECSLKAHERIHQSIPPFVCPECGKDFGSWKHLLAHLEEVCFHLTKQVRLRCPAKKCSKIFAQIGTFSTHFLVHMQCLIKCTLCEIIFFTEDAFADHSVSHNGKVAYVNVYKCTVCIDETEIYNDCKEHIYEHATNRKQCLYVYICKHCHNYFRSDITYANHLLRCNKFLFNNNSQSLSKSTVLFPFCKEKLKNNDKTVEMCICKQKNDTLHCKCNNTKNVNSSKKKNELAFNIKKQFKDANNLTKPTACLLCQEKLNIKELYDHVTNKKCKFHNPVVVLNNTNNIKQEFTITKTSETVKKKRKRSLSVSPNNKNKQSVLNSDNAYTKLEEPMPFDGTYYCKVCDYSNTNRSKFHDHVILHRDVSTAYQCMECGECFVVKPSLNKHLLYYHQVTDLESYFDENNCFDKKAVKELEDVMRLAPGESKHPVAENQCRVCMQKFNNSLELNKHFRVHGMAFLLKKLK